MAQQVTTFNLQLRDADTQFYKHRAAYDWIITGRQKHVIKDNGLMQVQ
jgi:hypothetical protein